jgi:hypothetical protein
MLERIIERVEAQKRMPLAAPLEREGPERCLVIGKTPYLVLYAVSESELTVTAVYHAAQNR